jgi:glycosyltransferase involved in cell wall biosynthesis
MRILYLTHYFPPEFGAAAARAESMARLLAQFGHTVTVVTSFPNYLMADVPPVYRGKRWVEEKMGEVFVYRSWVYVPRKKSNWGRLGNYVSFATSSWYYARRLTGPFDVILASSPPLFVGLTGIMLARRFQIPLVFEARDLWPQTAIKSGAMKASSPTARTLNLLANTIYRHARMVVPVTAMMEREMLELGLPPEKLALIPNGVDLAGLVENPPDLREELGLQNKFVVVYAGLLGVMQGVEILIDVARELVDSDIHFLIVGDGVRRPLIERLLSESRLQNVTLIPPQPREEIPRYLQTADVCLALLANDGLMDAVPTKMLEAWAYRRPVIITSTGDGAAVLQRCGGGLAVPPGDPKALAEAILYLKAHPDERQGMGENGRRCIEEELNREKLARKMEHVLRSVVEGKA